MEDAEGEYRCPWEQCSLMMVQRMAYWLNADAKTPAPRSRICNGRLDLLRLGILSDTLPSFQETFLRYLKIAREVSNKRQDIRSLRYLKQSPVSPP